MNETAATGCCKVLASRHQLLNSQVSSIHRLVLVAADGSAVVATKRQRCNLQQIETAEEEMQRKSREKREQQERRGGEPRRHVREMPGIKSQLAKQS